MPGQARAKSKKRAASADLEPVDEIRMDAQSPGGNNDSGAAEPPPDPRLLELLKEDPPNTYLPVQELRKYSQCLNQHRKETEEFAHQMESLCRKNEEKEKSLVKMKAGNAALNKQVETVMQEKESLHDKLRKMKAENAALKKQVETVMQEKESLHDTLRHLRGAKYEIANQLKSVKEACLELTEEKSELQERSAQLTLDLAQANEAVRALAEECDLLRSALQDHEAEEEMLQGQLRERERRMSELSQVHDANIREHDRLVAEQSQDLLANQNHIEELNKRLKTELEQGEAVRREKQTLNDILKEERKKNEELKVKVQEHSASISDLMRERESLQDQIRNLEDTVKRTTQKTAELGEDSWQVLRQFQGVGKCALGVHTQLMQDLMPHAPDIVRAVSAEGNTIGVDTLQVFMESIETANYSTHLANSRFQESPHLPADLPEVTMQILVYFTRQMGRWWKFIAYALGVEEQATLLADSQEAADLKCLTVLQTWIDQGPDVTWKNLLDALWGLGLRSTAIGICEKLNQMADVMQQ